MTRAERRRIERERARLVGFVVEARLRAVAAVIFGAGTLWLFVGYGWPGAAASLPLWWLFHMIEPAEIPDAVFRRAALDLEPKPPDKPRPSRHAPRTPRKIRGAK